MGKLLPSQLDGAKWGPLKHASRGPQLAPLHTPCRGCMDASIMCGQLPVVLTMHCGNSPHGLKESPVLTVVCIVGETGM